MNYNRRQAQIVANALRGEVPSLELFDCYYLPNALDYCLGKTDLTRQELREIVVQALIEDEETYLNDCGERVLKAC